MRKNNGQWILKSRPQGLVERVNFEWREEPIPTILDGQFLVRNLWLSCDPTQRLWMQFDTYIPAGRQDYRRLGLAGLRGHGRVRAGAGHENSSRGRFPDCSVAIRHHGTNGLLRAS